MDFNLMVAVMGALGLGGVLTVLIQIRNENKNKKKQRLFEEKKAAYLKYIQAIQESQFLPHKEGGWLRTAAMGGLELFANKDVLEHLEILRILRDTDLTQPLKALFQAMRKDLDSYY